MDKYLKRKKIYVAPKTTTPVAPQTSESPPPISFGKQDDSMAAPGKKAKQEELEVTGVSRSGRVRKKSSKLTDFESPDEIDPRYKRKADRVPAVQVANDAENAPQTSTPKQKKSTPSSAKASKLITPPVVMPSPTRSMGSEEEEVEEEESYTHGMKADFDSDSEAAMLFSQQEEVIDEESSDGESHDDVGTADSGDELLEDDDDDDDDEEGQLVMVDDGPKPSRPTNQGMSLYMLEKSTKKRLVVKDGKIVGRKKAQRKDKGKSRFTAYMLWAKEARKDILRSNPDMDFATTSKRLGELWGIVPNSEKYTWRRRAKRLSVKQKADELKAAMATQQGGTGGRNKFINKTPATPKNTSPPKPKQERRSSQSSQNQSQGQLGTLAAAAAVAQQQQLLQQQQLQQQQLQNALAAAATDVKLKSANSEVQGAGMFKAVGTAPVDVASHLKLLGESLLIIGERLKEHEGQIAVSGSFSVLLDSLLCAMAPLICLTQQVSELNGCPSETLSQTLDNIAYIMPGL